jgi:hypothetical protein
MRAGFGLLGTYGLQRRVVPGRGLDTGEQVAVGTLEFQVPVARKRRKTATSVLQAQGASSRGKLRG